MGLEITAVLAGLFLAATVFCGWRGARPPKVLGEPRLVPWRALMVGCFVATLAFLTHLVTLLKAP